MAVEKQIRNTYQIFKLAWDNSNWMYVSEGPVMPSHDIHCPQSGNDLQKFTDNLINEHMQYLKDKGCQPRNPACSHICFSYEPTYESAIRHSEIWHAQKLSTQEIGSFEQCAIRSHLKYWQNK